MRRRGDLESQLQKQRDRLLREYRRNVLGVVVANPRPLLTTLVEEAWISRLDLKRPAPIVRLLDGNSSKADASGVFALIYFLSHVARHPDMVKVESDRTAGPGPVKS